MTERIDVSPITNVDSLVTTTLPAAAFSASPLWLAMSNDELYLDSDSPVSYTEESAVSLVTKT